MCIEWWNFYIYSSYFGKFPKLFPKRLNNNNTFSDYQIAHDSILFELLSIVLTYKILIEIYFVSTVYNYIYIFKFKIFCRKKSIFLNYLLY